MNSEIIIYTTDDGITKIETKFDNDTVWLSQEQMAELFQKDRTVIGRHIRNIFNEGELNESLVCAKFAHTKNYGRREGFTQEVLTTFYNLDVIISVGYRVKSQRGTQFRIWANQLIKEYLIKGFAMNDEKLKGNAGGNYWKELLERIRDIRSSEKVLYRQVLDLYATSVDYNPKAEESVQFFKIVQNKLHYAAHGHTAAEVIFERANSNEPFMGLKTFSGSQPTAKDVVIAKNYLNENELKILNRLVSGYFDLAEINAIEHKPMYMSDYVANLDSMLSAGNRKLLQDAGKISHLQATEKAMKEYQKYQVKTLTPVEEAYFETINKIDKLTKKKGV